MQVDLGSRDSALREQFGDAAIRGLRVAHVLGLTLATGRAFALQGPN